MLNVEIVWLSSFPQRDRSLSLPRFPMMCRNCLLVRVSMWNWGECSVWDDSRETSPEDEDLAALVVNRLRAAAAARGMRPGVHRPRKRKPITPVEISDGRDPVALGDLAHRIVAERGWNEPLPADGVVGRWGEIGGEKNDENCVPE